MIKSIGTFVAGALTMLLIVSVLDSNVGVRVLHRLDSARVADPALPVVHPDGGIIPRLDEVDEEGPLSNAAAADESLSPPRERDLNSPQSTFSTEASTAGVIEQEVRADVSQPSLPAQDPIPFLEEMAEMFEGPMGELHAEVESESADVSWSEYMEAQFMDYFNSKPALANFNILLVECRTTSCEVQAMGYGETANLTWLNETADITRQPWYDFNDGGGSSSALAPGILGILWVYQRRN